MSSCIGKRGRSSAVGRRCVGVAAIAAVALAMAAQSALAYTHTWTCNYASSAYTCYDYVGQTYNPWESVVAVIAYSRSEICAKAKTAAQNIRTGSGCNYNTTARTSNIAGGYPESVGYVYWAGSGSTISITGRASTSD